MFDGNVTAADCGDDLRERWERARDTGEAICRVLADEVIKLGLPEKAHSTAVWERARFELQRDPASGQTSLVGTWKDTRGQRLGGVIFHCDGSFYAEYDVVEPHPRDKRWFVEAVVAWGKNATIKAEARLLPALA